MSDLSRSLLLLGLAPSEVSAVFRLPDPRVIAGWSEENARLWGISARSFERLQAALSLATSLVSRNLAGSKITAIRDFGPLLAQFGAVDREFLVVVALDAGGLILGSSAVASGGAQGVMFDYSQVFRFLCQFRADGGAIVHNHPCHDRTPSPQDRAIARDFAKLCEIAGFKCWGFGVWGAGRCDVIEPAR